MDRSKQAQRDGRPFFFLTGARACEWGHSKPNEMGGYFFFPLARTCARTREQKEMCVGGKRAQMEGRPCLIS